MDQKKIGSFIAECRKGLGMTQNQLAMQLGITDKAVSKWETGRSMPDVSLFMQLCDILHISVNELIAGEHIEADKLKEKSEEILMEVVAHKQKGMFAWWVVQIVSSIIMGVGVVLILLPSLVDLSKEIGMIIALVGLLSICASVAVRIKHS